VAKAVESGAQGFEVDEMCIELADLDGDVDAAVEILARTPAYGPILRRLRAAGRDEDYMTWLDRAVAAGRQRPDRYAAQGDPLSASEIVKAYRAAGRAEDAMDVLQALVAEYADPDEYVQLMELAEAYGRHAEQRTRAWWVLRQRAQQNGLEQGGPMIRIALIEGDVQRALDICDEFGPGRQWELLAGVVSESHPRRSYELYRTAVERGLTTPDVAKYPGIAQELLIMADVAGLGGFRSEFADYLEALRQTYRRRTSLMKALDRAGLT
jgi:hypothetical protein